MNWILMYIIAGILLLPMLIYGLFAQANIQNVFRKYLAYPTRSNITASELAKALLLRSGIKDVEVVPIKGHLDDCYDPKRKVVKISVASYNLTSVAALGVAAHEVGHAVQHHNKSFLFRLRSAIVPVVNIISKMYIPLVLAGSIMNFMFWLPTVGFWICWGSVIAYGASLIFYLVTLPLEFDASKRAIQMMRETESFSETELKQAKHVLNAAAQTYIATSLTQLIYFLRFLSYAMIFSDNRR